MSEICSDEKTRRFDDVYRLLLVIAGVFFSYSLAFYREKAGIRLFNFIMLLPLISVAFWSIGRLGVLAKSREVTWRILSLWFLNLYVATMATDPLTYVLNIPYSHPYPFLLTWAVVIFTALSVVFFTRYLRESIPASQKWELYFFVLFVTCGLLFFSLKHFFPEFWQWPSGTTAFLWPSRLLLELPL